LNLAQTPGQQDGLAVDSLGNLYAVDAGNVRAISYSGPFFPTVTPTPSPTSTALSTPTTTPTPTFTSTPTHTPIPSPTPTTSISAKPKKLDFGKVEATSSGKSKTLTLKNDGAVLAQFGRLSTSTSFSLSNDNCSNMPLQPGQKCAVDVTFKPPTVSNVSATLAVPYNGVSPARTLEGTGIAMALKAPNAKTLPGAPAGALGKAVTVTISNKHHVTVQLAGPIGLTNALITSDSCTNRPLAPEATCAVTLKFAPPAGSRKKLTDHLSYAFTYGANSGQVTVFLKGTVTKSQKLRRTVEPPTGRRAAATLTSP
jgi:hypothetical protein